ncbi:helix-turn-helix domain-containing protein [Paenibacillus sp. GCM10027627]
MNLHQGMGWFQEQKMSAVGNAQFIIVTYGKCIYWIGGEKTILEKGDFLLIPPGSVFYGKSVPTVFHEKFVIEFTMAPETADLPLLMKTGKFVKSKAGCYDFILEKIRSVWKEWREPVPYAGLRASSALLEAIALWGRELDRGEPSSLSLQHAERMKNYIHDHYRGKMTKELLGDIIGRSPNHAATLFKRVTGVTISEYVHAIRMRTAAYMLTESLLNITEIADYLGYSDVSYFQRMFKKTFGVPPSHYLNERPVQV